MEPARPSHLPPLSVGTGRGGWHPSTPAPHAPVQPPPPLPPTGLFSAIREDDVWDNHDEHEEALVLESARGSTKSAHVVLKCTRGSQGVSGLALAGQPDELLRTGSFADTLSAAATVHGSTRKWVRGDAIGRGSMGTVFQAMDQQSGQVIAVKEVAINPDDASDVKFKEQLENEVRICKDLVHPRIVSFLGHDYINSCLYIYLEYMAGGSMAQVLKQFGAFEESLIAVYTRELLEGLEYLHTREPPVVHRDVKSANVLVGLDTRVKLSDFGCSKRTMETMSHTIKGSIPWMAPEVITNTGYGRKADIWSFGCVVIEMATARSPWGKFDNPMAAMLKIGMSKELPPIPQGLSETCSNFIHCCVQRDKEHRPPASDLLQHDFVRDLLTDG